MTGAAIRLARPSDAPALAAVLADAAPGNVLPMTIYGCHGISAFIRAELDAPWLLAERVFAVADAGGTIVGAAELRRLDGTLFLNQIAVAARARNQGIASRVLAHGIEAANGAAAWREIRLDVFEENATASRWYERLGFEEVSRTEWWEVRLESPAPGESASTQRTCITGFAQARACHEAYGFSEFSVTTPQGRYSVGRLGSGDLRVTQPDAIEDVDLLNTLRELTPGGKLLALVPPGRFARHHELPARMMSTTRRMACSTAVVLQALHRTTETRPT